MSGLRSFHSAALQVPAWTNVKLGESELRGCVVFTLDNNASDRMFLFPFHRLVMATEEVLEGSCCARVFQCPGGLTCLTLHKTNMANNLLQCGWGDGTRLHVHMSFDHPHMGWTVSTKKQFVKGEAITIYDGNLVHRSYGARASDVSASTLTHVHALHDYVVYGLDMPLAGRGVGSFINHTFNANTVITVEKGLWPYYGFIPLSSDDAFYLLIRAKRNIDAGDELSLRYAKSTCARLGILYHDVK